ncbi:MAG TPA: hypothetical protein VGH04_08015, partial [Gemmatimonadaceae bacterium]
MRPLVLRVALFAGVASAAACVGASVRTAPATPEPRLSGAPTAAPQPDTNYIDLLDGTLSGKGDLSEDEAPKVGHVRLPSLLTRWFKAKQQFEDSTGLSFAGSYGALGQNYSTSPVDEPN